MLSLLTDCAPANLLQQEFSQVVSCSTLLQFQQGLGGGAYFP